MPLPFLTADRAFEAADDVALPFDDHDRWRRPYRPGPWRVGAAALAAARLVRAVRGRDHRADRIACPRPPRLSARRARHRRRAAAAAGGRVGERARAAPCGLPPHAHGAVGAGRRRADRPAAGALARTAAHGPGPGADRRPAGAARRGGSAADHAQRGLPGAAEAFDRAADAVEAWAAENRRG